MPTCFSHSPGLLNRIHALPGWLKQAGRCSLVQGTRLGYDTWDAGLGKCRIGGHARVRVTVGGRAEQTKSAQPSTWRAAKPHHGGVVSLLRRPASIAGMRWLLLHQRSHPATTSLRAPVGAKWPGVREAKANGLWLVSASRDPNLRRPEAAMDPACWAQHVGRQGCSWCMQWRGGYTLQL